MTMSLQLCTVALLAAAAVAAPVTITVDFPGGSGSEYTLQTPAHLPNCTSNTWQIEGQTYDSLTTCTSSATTTISVIPFRCASYSTTANAKHVVDCASCYYAWSYTPANDGQIVSYASSAAVPSGTQLGAYFVPQTITNQANMRSCLMVQDAGLSTLCDSITRASLSGNAAATCNKGTKKTPITGLSDNSGCTHFALQKNGKITCQSS